MYDDIKQAAIGFAVICAGLYLLGKVSPAIKRQVLSVSQLGDGAVLASVTPILTRANAGSN